MTKTRVDVEDVFQNADERWGWNRRDLEDLEFYRDGVKVDVPKKALDDFVFTGLNNTDFILDYDWPE